MQGYINQLKDIKLFNLVQSQPPTIIYEVIQTYGNEFESSKTLKINEIDQDGFTALHKACVRGIPEIVDMLLQNGSDGNIKNKGGETAAHLAAKRGSPIVLNLLKNFETNFEILDIKGQSLAHHAIYNDSVFVLMWIESSTELSLNSKDALGQTPLHLAFILGKVNCMKFLLKKSRANLMEKTSKTRDTCLHLAIANHQLHCVPHILFESTKKKSLFASRNLIDEDESSIFLIKNANKKTAIDVFMDQSQEYKSSNRSFWFFFFMSQLISVNQLKTNFDAYRLYLYIFPFVSFSFGIILSLCFDPYRIYIFFLTSILCMAYVRMQGHRISSLDIRQNPVFAGAYMAGICHDLVCFMLNILPRMRGSEWEIIFTVLTLPLFGITYLRLLIAEPGRLQMSEIKNYNFKEFLDEELMKQKNNKLGTYVIPLDKFCNVCEVLPSVERVKHCKLCDMCIVDMDHHCLFLMKCVGRNNLRNFVFLIIISIVLMAVFIEVSFKCLILACGPLSGANPIEFLFCSYRSETWISTAIAFNGVSLCWAACMLFYQLSVISHNSTAYFLRRSQKVSLRRKVVRILYFLIHGTFYQTNEAKDYLTQI